jgi:cytochrome oxidase Cu insertion factor (SCO1/SenC/PrrC family)
MLKLIRWVSTGLIAVLAIAWGVVWLAQRAPDGNAARVVRWVQAQMTPPGPNANPGTNLGGPFSLTDMHGRAVTDSTYRGRWMLVYFGYAFCPDVCPTELQSISTALDELGPDAAKIVPLFITIDPARDTPAALAQYVRLFDDRLIGLTGTPEQVAAAAHAYRVYYAKVPMPDTQAYLMDHSSFVYLMGPDGKFRALLSPSDGPDAIARRVQADITGHS